LEQLVVGGVSCHEKFIRQKPQPPHEMGDELSHCNGNLHLHHLMFCQGTQYSTPRSQILNKKTRTLNDNRPDLLQKEWGSRTGFGARNKAGE
jgi:hypothetical protein